MGAAFAESRRFDPPVSLRPSARTLGQRRCGPTPILS